MRQGNVRTSKRLRILGFRFVRTKNLQRPVTQCIRGEHREIDVDRGLRKVEAPMIGAAKLIYFAPFCSAVCLPLISKVFNIDPKTFDDAL